MMIQKMFDLTGRKAFVTGSSRGIGKAIAFALGQAGAAVIFHGTAMNDKLHQTLEEAKAMGIHAEVVTGDLSSQADLDRLCREVRGVDIAVLNASIQKYQTLPDFDKEDFQKIFNVNVAATFQFIRELTPSMIEKKWGRVLTIGSVNQWKQSPRLCIYAATKSAQSNLVMNCARTYSEFGITFNNLAPGVIATDRNKAALADEAMVEKLLLGIPAKRFGQAEDCAGPALLLCSDAGSYITGTDIPVAGGMQL